jgi:hypothetical protein
LNTCNSLKVTLVVRHHKQAIFDSSRSDQDVAVPDQCAPLTQIRMNLAARTTIVSVSGKTELTLQSRSKAVNWTIAFFEYRPRRIS